MSQPIKITLLGFVALASIALVVFPRWTVDDAYISMRYAENLARHGELNWNVGEEPVEGYTGVAWPVVLAGSMRVNDALGLGPAPESFARAVGIAALFAAAFLLWLCIGELAIRESVRAAAVVVLLTTPLMATHATSGLETTAFMAAIMGSLYLFAVCMRRGEGEGLEGGSVRGGRLGRLGVRAEIGLAGALLITSLIRPEGVVLAGLIALALAVIRLRGGGGGFRKGQKFRWAGVFTLVYILPAACYFAWRFRYYGQLLPNTFYVKSFDGWINPASARSLGLFLYTYVGASAAAVAVIAAMAFLSSKSKERQEGGPHKSDAAPAHAALVVCVGLAFAAIVFAKYARSHLIMNYSYRFFAPLMPVLLLGLAVAAERALQRLELGGASMTASRLRITASLLVLIALVQGTVVVTGWRGEVAYVRLYRQVMADQHLRAAALVARFVPAEERPAGRSSGRSAGRRAERLGGRLAVYEDAGVIPYKTRLPTTDFGKLNDRRLSRGNMNAAEVADYFFEVNPAAAVFTSRNWRRLEYDDAMAAIAADPRFARYHLAEKFRTTSEALGARCYEFVYFRDDVFLRYAEASSDVELALVASGSMLSRD